MKNEIKPSVVIEDKIEVMNATIIELGQWVWATSKHVQSQEEYEWFGCVSQVGSNYIEVSSLKKANGSISYKRVHFDELSKFLRIEDDPQKVIAAKVATIQYELKLKMDRVKEITARLGVDQQALTHQNTTQSKELAVLSGQSNVDTYKSDLIKAKEETLPELFKEIKEGNADLAKWLSAESLPLVIASHQFDGAIGAISDRIFNVSLYAGLIEDVVQCSEGEPAQMTDKLHIMQRKLYMDEECLLGYKTGGIEIKDIEVFDEWISTPEHRDRILPFSRCIVAMQVRRNDKKREHRGNMREALINIQLAEFDKITFLFIRNGKQIYRINCDLDFDDLIFPNQEMFDMSEPMMVEGQNYSSMMTEREYEHRLAESKAGRANYEQWCKDNPQKEDEDSYHYEWRNPYKYTTFSSSGYAPFNNSHLYFDEISKDITNRIKKYNRIALIIQGLLDRSMALHPHPPIKTWEPDSFNEFIKLVSDGSNVLHYKEAPDFEVYRAKCNSSLNKDSIVTGQYLFWLHKEADKENKRIDSSWRDNSTWRHTTYEPYGNPGPDDVSAISRWMPKARKAVFVWQREKLRKENYWDDDMVRVTLTVPSDSLFNISAYKVGDFKQFFNDPRTRQHYLKWAPTLIAAEEYKAKMLKEKQ